jgi:hypothetical protein
MASGRVQEKRRDLTISWLAGTVRTLQSRVTFLEGELKKKDEKKEKDPLQRWYDSDSEMDFTDLEDQGGIVWDGEAVGLAVHNTGDGSGDDIDEVGKGNDEVDEDDASPHDQGENNERYIVSDLAENFGSSSDSEFNEEKEEEKQEDIIAALENLEGYQKELMESIRKNMAERDAYEGFIGRSKGEVERLIRKGAEKEWMADIIGNLTYASSEIKRLNEEIEAEGRKLARMMKMKT